jgi:hypothetical protein
MQGDSSESSQEFIILRNAFETIMVQSAASLSENGAISNPAKENQNRRAASVGSNSHSTSFDRRFSQQLNWLLWDVEDLFRTNRKSRNSAYFGDDVLRDILRVLVLLDKYILSSLGFHDHFMTARNLPQIDPENYLGMFESGRVGEPHMPYTSVENYFFDIRKRMNSLLEEVDHNIHYLWEHWSDKANLETIVNIYQNCVYNVSRIQDCLNRDEKFKDDFVKMREMIKTEI